MFCDENSNNRLDSCDLGESFDIPAAHAFFRILLFLPIGYYIVDWTVRNGAPEFFEVEFYKLDDVLFIKLPV